MKNVIVCVLLAVLSVGMAHAAPMAHVLRYERPADDNIWGWEQQSLPIGNGWFGANVFGGLDSERIQITENTVLTKNNLTDALELRLTFAGHHRGWKGYRRELDIDRGLARVTYRLDGVDYVREFFTSYPDRVMAIRLTASKPGALKFGIEPEIPFRRPFGVGRETFVGRTGEMTASGNTIDVRQHLQFYNVRFFGRFAVRTDGKVETLHHTLDVTDATEALIVFSCGTNYKLGPEVFRTNRNASDEAPEAEAVARGAVEVDCAWKDGKPVSVVLRPKKGVVPEVRFAGQPFMATVAGACGELRDGRGSYDVQ